MVRTNLDRRSFLRSAAGWTALVSLPSVYAYTWQVEPYWIEVVRRDLPIARLPKHLAGKTLVQISDLHVGTVNDAYLVRTLEQVNALKPDILVNTGDYMTCKLDEKVEPALRIMEHLQPGRIATVGILGNHDYGAGARQVKVADQLVAGLEKQGMRMLRNESCEVEGLQIAGIDDVWAPCYAPEKVMPKLDPQRAQLVLCHNPDVADLPVWAGYRGWILSGHTHGGQCKAPLFGPPFLPVVNQRYTAGEFDVGEGRRLYINRGIGYTVPFRFNVRPEITVFTLRQAEAETQSA